MFYVLSPHGCYTYICLPAHLILFDMITVTIIYKKGSSLYNFLNQPVVSCLWLISTFSLKYPYICPSIRVEDLLDLTTVTSKVRNSDAMLPHQSSVSMSDHIPFSTELHCLSGTQLTARQIHFKLPDRCPSSVHTKLVEWQTTS
jgi:hypothetical protein